MRQKDGRLSYLLWDPGPYKLLRSILALVKLSEKTFEELTEVLKVTITRHHQR